MFLSFSAEQSFLSAKLIKTEIIQYVCDWFLFKRTMHSYHLLMYIHIYIYICLTSRCSPLIWFNIVLFSIRDSIGFALTNRIAPVSPQTFFSISLSYFSLAFLLKPNIKIIRSLLPVYINTPTNSFRNNFIITDRCIKFASICYWMMMASAHHTNRHTTDLCTQSSTSSRNRKIDRYIYIYRERESKTKMKLSHFFDTLIVNIREYRQETAPFFSGIFFLSFS